MKRIMAIFLCLTLLLAVPAMAEGMKAGTYTETVKGMFVGLVVEVTLSDGAIENVVIKEHNETSPGYPALEKLPGMIVEAQSIAVDGISGATMTSNGVKAAVEASADRSPGQIWPPSPRCRRLRKTSRRITIPVMGSFEVPETWDESYDVVVVGGGLRGPGRRHTAP